MSDPVNMTKLQPSPDWLRIVSRASSAVFAGALLLLLGDLLRGAAPDILALSMSVLTLFISTIVLHFSDRHLRADAHRSRYALLVAGFAAALITLAWASNLVLLALAWLASGAILARLVGHVPGWDEAVQARRRCTRAFAASNIALIVALGLLAGNAGSLQLDRAATAAAESPTIALIGGALVLIAAMARSALPPFAGWLLGSMSAPTPVSALMHGGFVSAGGFLLIRFAGLWEAAPPLQAATLAIGLCAAFYGTGIMLVRADVKGVLAGSTVAQMGFMVLTCGLGFYGAALWHIIGHALFKSWLFLTAGSTIGMRVRETGRQSSARSAVLILAGVSAAGSALYAALPVENANWFAGLLALLTIAVAIDAGGKTGWRTIAWTAPFLGLSILVAEALGAKLGGYDTAHVPATVPAGITAIIFAGWILQQHFAARGLPRPVYLFLLNAGVLHAR